MRSRLPVGCCLVFAGRCLLLVCGVRRAVLLFILLWFAVVCCCCCVLLSGVVSFGCYLFCSLFADGCNLLCVGVRCALFVVRRCLRWPMCVDRRASLRVVCCLLRSVFVVVCWFM